MNKKHKLKTDGNFLEFTCPLQLTDPVCKQTWKMLRKNRRKMIFLTFVLCGFILHTTKNERILKKELAELEAIHISDEFSKMRKGE